MSFGVGLGEDEGYYMKPCKQVEKQLATSSKCGRVYTVWPELYRRHACTGGPHCDGTCAQRKGEPLLKEKEELEGAGRFPDELPPSFVKPTLKRGR